MVRLTHVVLLIAMLGTAMGCSDATRSLTAPSPLAAVDRVSLLAWKDALGVKYRLTIAQPDSIAVLLQFFAAKQDQWAEQEHRAQIPNYSGFYRGGQLASQRGFAESSHNMGGVLVIEENNRRSRGPRQRGKIAQFLASSGSPPLCCRWTLG